MFSGICHAQHAHQSLKKKVYVALCVVLTCLLVSSSSFVALPQAATAASNADSVVISSEGEINTNTKSVTVTVNGCDSLKGGFLFLASAKQSNSWTSWVDTEDAATIKTTDFTGAGDYTFDLSNTTLQAGRKLVAYVYSGENQSASVLSNAITIRYVEPETPDPSSGTTDPVDNPGTTPGTGGADNPSQPGTGEGAGTGSSSDPDTSTPGKTYTEQEILAGCSVQLTRVDGGEFRAGDTQAKIKVKLHSSVPSTILNLYSYPTNGAFDSDNDSVTKRLISGKEVKDGDEFICNFTQNTPLQVGRSIIASLNVKVSDQGDGIYKLVNSAPVRVVDENGQGFKDYTYPNAWVTEKNPQAGATKLHLSLTGDDRLFQYAKDSNVDFKMCIAVRMYPADQEFTLDPEGDQVSVPLYSNFNVTEALDNVEIPLTEPLRPGYKVRAVVYWTQNPSLFIPKANDYEAQFGMPDDSVLVTGSAVPGKDPEVTQANVSLAAVSAGATSLQATVGGTVASGTNLLVKSFDAATTSFSASEGTLVGLAQSVSTGKVEIKSTGTIESGKKLVAFLMNTGKVLAQSNPVVVQTQQAGEADPKPQPGEDPGTQPKDPQAVEPQIQLSPNTITAGMTYAHLSFTFDDKQAAQVSLYQFTGDKLNTQTATLLAGPSTYYKANNDAQIYIRRGKLQAGNKLQAVIQAGDKIAYSNVVEVQPSPDWGTPSARINVKELGVNETSIPLTVDYSDEYLKKSGFYCNITVYAFPGTYSDEDFENKELDESPSIARRVAEANCNSYGYNDQTKGTFNLTLKDSANLKPGEKLIVKLRLPHPEWDDDANYLSPSVVVGQTTVALDNPSKDPEQENPAKPSKTVTVPQVSGASGVSATGSLTFAASHAGAQDNATHNLQATQISSGQAYDTIKNGIGQGMLASVYDVLLHVDGTQIHDGFGTFTLSFPVDAAYNNRLVRIWHLHHDGALDSSEWQQVKDGKVSVSVSDLSSFGLEIGDVVRQANAAENGDAAGDAGATGANTTPNQDNATNESDDGAGADDAVVDDEQDAADNDSTNKDAVNAQSTAKTKDDSLPVSAAALLMGVASLAVGVCCRPRLACLRAQHRR